MVIASHHQWGDDEMVDIGELENGDTAYILEPILPAILIGFGVVWVGVVLVLVRVMVRGSRRPPA